MKHILIILITIFANAFFTKSVAQIVTLDSSFNTNGYNYRTDIWNEISHAKMLLTPSQEIIVPTNAMFNVSGRNCIKYKSDGTQDTNFHSNPFGIPAWRSQTLNASLQQDNKILICGTDKDSTAPSFYTESLYITRLKANGHIDSGFGTNGVFVKTIDTNIDNIGIGIGAFTAAYDVQELSNGKLVAVCGYGGIDREAFTLQLNANGSIDSSYGIYGYYFLKVPGFNKISTTCMLKLPSNKIIIAGTARDTTFPIGFPGGYGLFFARINTNGTLDNTFGNNGYIFKGVDSNYNYVSSIIFESATKIVFKGLNQHLLPPAYSQAFNKEILGKIDINGILDNSINGIGYKIFSIDNKSAGDAYICKQNSGKIFTVTRSFYKASNNTDSTNYYRFTRYNNNLEIDSTFGINGHHYLSEFFYAALEIRNIINQPDDKILICGNNMDSVMGINWAFIARFNCKYNGPVGILQIEMPNAQVLLFPNPAQDKIRLLYHFNNNVQFIVYGASGAIVLQKELLANQDACDINTSNLLEGLYTYVIVNNGHLSNTGKLVIKR
jgi:uncharacterized delta-60 repeat protein